MWILFEFKSYSSTWTKETKASPEGKSPSEVVTWPRSWNWTLLPQLRKKYNLCNFQFSDDLKMAKWCEVGKKWNSRDTWKPTKGHKSDWLMGRLLTNNPDLFSLTGFSFWNNHIEPQGWDKGQDRWRKSKLCLDIFYMNNADIHVGPEHFAVFKENTKEDLNDHTKIFRHTSREPTVLHLI